MGIFGTSEPESIEIAGRPLQCSVCQNDRFWKRQAQLNTAVATFFKFDWANESADCYVCSKCGYVHWFVPPA